MHTDTAALRRHVLARAPLCAPGDGPVLGLVFVTLFGALALDAAFGMTGQVLGSLAVWALLLVLLARMTPAWRRTLVIATAFALAAELFFSLVLGWYDYQFLNVPAFVPPGHVLLFLLGPALACRLPQWLVIAVPLAAGAWALWASLTGIGPFDGLLCAVFLLAYRFGRSRPTYALMLLLALALELWGTGLGNWRWQPVVPGLGLATVNPPLLAGTFYALFDMYVMLSARACHRHFGDLPGAAQPGERSRMPP